MRALFVCTANICRSPMAAGLFARAARTNGADRADRDDRALVASAGFLPAGRPTHESVVELLGERGIDVSRKQSRTLSPELVDNADLILTMTCEHARGVVSRFPDTIDRVYTLRDFATLVTPRQRDESIEEWLDGINSRNRRAYLGDDDLLDIADPIGEPMHVFQDLVVEIEGLIEWIMTCAYTADTSSASNAP